MVRALIALLSAPRLWLAIAIAALAVLLGLQTWRLHTEQLAHRDLQVQHASQVAEQQRQLAEATASARATEQNLITQAAQAEKVKNDQIATLALDADRLRRRLRDAAATRALVSATAPTPSPAGAAAGGDRSEVSGSLGDALVSEAERADKLRVALAQCTSQYNAAREALMQH